MTYTLDRIRIAERFYKKRKEMGLTQRQLCRYLRPYGISLGQYQRAEQSSEKVSLSYLAKIASALHISIDGLLPAGTETLLDPQDWQQAFYPRYSDCKDGSYQTRNLFRLFIYQPLFPARKWRDLQWRVSGLVPGNEEYLLDLLADLYEQIPASPALDYLRHIDEYICHIPLNDPAKELQWQEKYHLRNSDPKVLEGYRAYRRLLADRLGLEE